MYVAWAATLLLVIATTMSEAGLWSAKRLTIPLHRKRDMPLVITIENAEDFDYVSHITGLQVKYASNAHKYYSNMGAHLPFFNSTLLPKFLQGISKRDGRPGVDKRGLVSLMAQHGGSLWTGDFAIGTPAQEFSIDFDTGSSDLWVTKNVPGKRAYKPGKSSSSSKVEGKTFSLGYGDGSQSQGAVYKDAIEVSGASATEQQFGVVSQVFGTLQQTSQDGIGGLAFPALSSIGAPNIIETLASQKAIPSKQFGFKLSRSGAQLQIGEIDETLKKSDMVWTPVKNKQYWSIDGLVKIAGVPRCIGAPLLIDTGTTAIIIPSGRTKEFFMGVPDVKKISGRGIPENAYSFPCDKAPSLSVVIEGREFPVDPTFVNGGHLTITDDDTGAVDHSRCLAAVGDFNVGQGDAYILGDVFLQNVLAVFDMDKSSVAFAEQK